MATAPLRKCMSVVAGTPVIESPTASVTISLPSIVTRTITALRWASAMVSLTTFITAAALTGSAEAEEEAEEETGPLADVHALHSPTRHTRTSSVREARFPVRKSSIADSCFLVRGCSRRIGLTASELTGSSVDGVLQ